MVRAKWWSFVLASCVKYINVTLGTSHLQTPQQQQKCNRWHSSKQTTYFFYFFFYTLSNLIVLLEKVSYKNMDVVF